MDSLESQTFLLQTTVLFVLFKPWRGAALTHPVLSGLRPGAASLLKLPPVEQDATFGILPEDSLLELQIEVVNFSFPPQMEIALSFF